LSSWVVRLAAQNALKLHTFSQMMWPAVPIWNRDIDNSATDDVLATLALRTGVAPDRVRETTLQSYEGRLFEKHNPRGSTVWLLPLGIYHRTRLRSGTQFCPDCLAYETPYYRKSWRLALSVVCLVHNRPLVDRCACDAPINFHRGDLGDVGAFQAASSMTVCYRCGFDLRKCGGSSFTLPLLCAALETQSRSNEALAKGYIRLADGSTVHSNLFFAGFRQLLQILSHGRLAASLRDSTAKWRRLPAYAPSFNGRISAIEKLPVHDRTVLIAMAGGWLNDWPQTFVKDCKTAGLTATDICRNLTRVPYWLARVVAEHFGQGTYSPSLPEIGAAINYLRTQNIVPTKSAVSQILGRTDVFRKRRLHHLLESEVGLFGDDGSN
jgi:hypothetical protein